MLLRVLLKNVWETLWLKLSDPRVVWQILCRWKLFGGFHVDADVNVSDIDVVDIDVNVDVDVDVVFVVIPKPLRNFPCTNKYVSSIENLCRIFKQLRF